MAENKKSFVPYNVYGKGLEILLRRRSGKLIKHRVDVKRRVAHSRRASKWKFHRESSQVYLAVENSQMIVQQKSHVITKPNN